MDFIVGKGVVSSEEHFRPFESVHNYIGNDNIIRKGVPCKFRVPIFW